MIHSRFVQILPLAGVLLLGSCIGLTARISVRGNGSGTLSLEYRFSRTVEALGKLDGNARWQTIPVGRADFERTLERLPGLRLASFSSREDGADMVNRAELEFTSLEALIPFLAGAGRGASLREEDGALRLSLILSPGLAENADPELLALVREISRPYRVTFSFSGPGEAELNLTGGGGGPLEAPDWVEAQTRGRNVSLSANTGDLLASPSGLGAEIIWRRTK
jgi:hypothetical protein